MLKTQVPDTIHKVVELRTIFPALDESEKDSALCILRALDFAQNTLYPTEKQQTYHKSKTEG